MGTHESDGITFRYETPHGTSWYGWLKAPGAAERRVPVTWAERADPESKGRLLYVYYKDRDERERQLQNGKPFLVALVAGHDNAPRKFKEYRCAWLVRPIKIGDDEHSLLTEFERRVTAKDFPYA